MSSATTKMGLRELTSHRLRSPVISILLLAMPASLPRAEILELHRVRTRNQKPHLYP